MPSPFRLLQGVAEPGADGMPQPHVGDQAGPEEAFFAGERTVDELSDDDEGAGVQGLLQRPAGADRDDLGDAGALHGVDVGAEVDLAGWNGVPAAVAGQEDHGLPVQVAEQQGVRRRAERGRDRLPPRVGQTVHIGDAAAADDADDRRRARFRHE